MRMVTWNIYVITGKRQETAFDSSFSDVFGYWFKMWRFWSISPMVWNVQFCQTGKRVITLTCLNLDKLSKGAITRTNIDLTMFEYWTWLYRLLQLAQYNVQLFCIMFDQMLDEHWRITHSRSMTAQVFRRDAKPLFVPL